MTTSHMILDHVIADLVASRDVGFGNTKRDVPGRARLRLQGRSDQKWSIHVPPYLVILSGWLIRS